jgi:hypothetical protein
MGASGVGWLLDHCATSTNASTVEACKHLLHQISAEHLHMYEVPIFEGIAVVFRVTQILPGKLNDQDALWPAMSSTEVFPFNLHVWRRVMLIC